MEWETLKLKLKLDQDQAIIIKYLVNRSKDRVIKILETVTENYGLSPLEYRADIKLQNPDYEDGVLTKKFIDYFSKEKKLGSNMTFCDIIERENSETEEEIARLLTKDQIKLYLDMQIRNIQDIETSYSPLRNKINQATEKAKAKLGIDIFCSIPFEYVYIDDTGEVYPCCPSKFRFSIGNLLNEPLRDIWGSKAAIAVRESILNKTFRFCEYKTCEYLKEAQIKYKSDKRTNKVTDNVYSDSKSTTAPKIINLAYDRSCNLACPSCRIIHFSCKGKDQEKTGIIHKNLFAKKLDDLERLIISGNGDPFTSMFYMDLLTNLDKGLYPDLKIKLQTNGLLLTPDKWKSIERSHYAIDIISISIDAATEETYKINRGGSFEKLLKNLEFVGKLRKVNEINFYIINFIVQANNYREMKQFIELGLKYNCDLIDFQCLEDWGAFSDEEFMKVAVHDKSHPEHNEFLKVLHDPIFAKPYVNADKLIEFLPDFLKEWVGGGNKKKYEYLNYS